MDGKRTKRQRVREASAGYGVTEVSASDLKNEWHRWLARVSDGGQTIVVTRYGKPIATLSPLQDDPGPHRIFGALSGSLTAAADLVSPTDEAWDSDE